MILYQLIYRSWAREQLPDEALQDLLVQARAFNQAQRITGILLYSTGQFVQVIEGGEPEVRALYAHICHDSRHTDVQLLAANFIPRRMFPDWTMGFATVAATEFAWLAGYTDTRKISFLLPRAHTLSPEVRKLLFDFMKQQLAPQ